MAIKEHPIPQNITTYKFRLVGNMTLVQFLEVLGGIGIAFIFWKSPLYPILKYPLILVSSSLGVLMAFVPFEERPLDVWLTSFIKKIYRPTLFIYHSLPHLPLYKTYKPEKREEATKLITTNKLSSFLKRSAHSARTSQEDLVHKYVNQLFQEEVVEPLVPKEEKTEKKQVQLPKVKMPQPTPPTKKKRTTPVSPPSTSSSPSVPVKKKEKKEIKKTPQVEVVLQKSPPSPKVKKTPTPKGAAPTFDTSLPTPTKANLPSGIILDENDHPLAGAIVEIKDKDGLPLRVTKTNMIGQFTLVTPLPSGDYLVTMEKDGYQAPPVELKLEGKVVKPLKIQAKAVKGA